MQRINGPGHINNRFTDGNPLTSTKATRITEGWLNSFQEELVNICAQAGVLLDPNNDEQLFQALHVLFISKAPAVAASNLAFVAGETLTIPHLNAAVPRRFDVYLQCVGADLGYVAGEETKAIGHHSVESGGSFSFGVAVSADATNMYVIIGVNGVNLYHKTNNNQQAANLSNWRLRVIGDP